MEINVTLFIQVWLITILFIFLPKLFFKPLDRILGLRKSLVLDKKLKTLFLYKKTKESIKHLFCELSLASKKISMLYEKYVYKINCHKEKVLLILKAKFSLRCSENIMRIISTKNISKKNFLLKKESIVNMIFKRIII